LCCRGPAGGRAARGPEAAPQTLPAANGGTRWLFPLSGGLWPLGDLCACQKRKGYLRASARCLSTACFLFGCA